MLALSIAWRQCRSAWAAGEIRVLLFALVLAVAATTAVGLFTDRIQSSMRTQGNVLLGADMVVNADHALPESYRAEAQKRQYQTTQTLEFSSMVVAGERNALAEIKAVEAGFPLRGKLTIQHSPTAQAHSITQGIPATGEVWIEPALAKKLDLHIGDTLSLGERTFKISAWLLQEPSRGGDLFNIAPRVLMNQQDVAATGLIQFGSRVKYQLLVASDASLRDYSAWLQTQLARGERIDDIRSARPEMRTALSKAQQFLGIASVVGVILAMAAMGLASLPYVQHSLDSYALMRCLGASKGLVTRILLIQAGLLALIGSVIGCGLGFAAQYGLATLADKLFLETLPAPSWLPLLIGLASGFATLLSVVWPQLLRLRDVPALRILRQDAEAALPATALRMLPAALVLAGLVLWHAGHLTLALIVLAALLALALVGALLAYIGLSLIKRFNIQRFSIQRFQRQYTGRVQGGMLTLGLMGLRRRPWLSIAQVMGLSMGMMAVLLLALIRADLLTHWQTSLPADAPNRFIINILADQQAGIQQFFADAQLPPLKFYPMVRARLLAINGQPVNVQAYTDDRAKRMVEREFNLSWTAPLPADNTLVAGKWWSEEDTAQIALSLEDKLAALLQLKLGDRLRYDVAGTPLELTLTSLRKVEWNNLHVNFLALTPPGVLNVATASYLTSVHLPADKTETLNALLTQFPNLTIINVSEVVEQLQTVIRKMSDAMAFVFGFSVLAGFAVLFAALMATRAARMRETSLMRVLGASRKQCVGALLVEFAAIGLLASGVATVFSNLAAYVLAREVLTLEYQLNVGLNLQVMLASALLVPILAWWIARHALNQPPRALLHSS